MTWLRRRRKPGLLRQASRLLRRSSAFATHRFLVFDAGSIGQPFIKTEIGIDIDILEHHPVNSRRTASRQHLAENWHRLSICVVEPGWVNEYSPRSIREHKHLCNTPHDQISDFGIISGKDLYLMLKFSQGSHLDLPGANSSDCYELVDALDCSCY